MTTRTKAMPVRTRDPTSTQYNGNTTHSTTPHPDPQQRLVIIRPYLTSTPKANFFTLPPELRDHVYSYLKLEAPPKIVITPRDPARNNSAEAVAALQQYVALNQTCRKMRLDVMRYFWAENEFAHCMGSIRQVMSLSSVIGHEAVRLLNNITIFSENWTWAYTARFELILRKSAGVFESKLNATVRGSKSEERTKQLLEMAGPLKNVAAEVNGDDCLVLEKLCIIEQESAALRERVRRWVGV